MMKATSHHIRREKAATHGLRTSPTYPKVSTIEIKPWLLRKPSYYDNGGRSAMGFNKGSIYPLQLNRDLHTRGWQPSHVGLIPKSSWIQELWSYTQGVSWWAEGSGASSTVPGEQMALTSEMPTSLSDDTRACLRSRIPSWHSNIVKHI